MHPRYEDGAPPGRPADLLDPINYTGGALVTAQLLTDVGDVADPIAAFSALCKPASLSQSMETTLHGSPSTAR